MHRFFLSDELVEGEPFSFPRDISRQISRVLRLREGARVIVLDDSGAEYLAELTSVGRRDVSATPVERRESATEPRVALTLYMPILRGKKNNWVLQKGTELGVTTFVPVLSNRAVVGSLSALGDGRVERWRTIVREAAEQSRRGRLPALEPPMLFDVALSRARNEGGPILIPWEEEEETSLRAALDAHTATDRVSLFIGPEGGFDADEILTARAYNATSITIGPRILRAETAAIAVIAAVMFALDEWR